MFRKLRGKIVAVGIDQIYLGEKLGLCESSVSARMTGKIDWRLNEMYAVLDLIHEPPETLNVYFPRNGQVTT